jgi:hypothetical protein
VDRGVSTVVDVAVALLLVSASVVVVVAATPPDARRDPDARTLATVLATTDASVPVAGEIARGTVAGLLADAAVLSASRPAFLEGVRARVNRTLGHVTDPAQVIARPVGNGSAMTVGEDPPPAVDVTAVSILVPAREPRNGTPVRIVTRTWSQ